ncbi:MAG: hypothetical protein SchgKO_24160 [Schleiferiaceae bacterium]
MKNLLLAFAVFGCVTAFAQPKDFEKKKEKVEAMRVAFITSEANITADEAQAFWPIYNELSEKMHKLEKEDRKARKKMHEGKADMSESELENEIQAHFRRDLQRAKLRKEYHEKLKQVLSIEKLADVYDAEFEFRRKLMKELRGRDGERGGRGGRGSKPGGE